MKRPQPMITDELVEALAEIEHAQWMHWSRAVAANVALAVRDKWKPLCVEYAELTDELKEADRVWARKVVSLLREHKLVR